MRRCKKTYMRGRQTTIVIQFLLTNVEIFWRLQENDAIKYGATPKKALVSNCVDCEAEKYSAVAAASCDDIEACKYSAALNGLCNVCITNSDFSVKCTAMTPCLCNATAHEGGATQCAVLFPLDCRLSRSLPGAPHMCAHVFIYLHACTYTCAYYTR